MVLSSMNRSLYFLASLKTVSISFGFRAYFSDRDLNVSSPARLFLSEARKLSAGGSYPRIQSNGSPPASVRMTVGVPWTANLL
jgi:hypothetical protein